MFGPSIDAASIGNANDPVPVHREGLSHGIRYVEVLTKNLGELPEHGGLLRVPAVQDRRLIRQCGAIALLCGRKGRLLLVEQHGLGCERTDEHGTIPVTGINRYDHL